MPDWRQLTQRQQLAVALGLVGFGVLAWRPSNLLAFGLPVELIAYCDDLVDP